jgi:hypothetical protein
MKVDRICTLDEMARLFVVLAKMLRRPNPKNRCKR